jgi:thymidylate synthase (FAD)
MSQVEIFDAPQNIDAKIAFLARVSSENQENPNYEKLISYLIKEGHWSPFDCVNITIEINTQKDIGIQLLRHQTLKPQEWSQRYADCSSMKAPLRECRLQDTNNRQNSLECTDVSLVDWWLDSQKHIQDNAFDLYEEALKRGIAKEVARSVLPIGLTNTKMYFNGSIRSWMFYCKSRLHVSTQKEHRIIAMQCLEKLREVAPVTMDAFFGEPSK